MPISALSTREILRFSEFGTTLTDSMAFSKALQKREKRSLGSINATEEPCAIQESEMPRLSHMSDFSLRITSSASFPVLTVES